MESSKPSDSEVQPVIKFLIPGNSNIPGNGNIDMATKNPPPSAIQKINMFHVFALAYLTTGFLLPTLLFFRSFASASVYTVPLYMCGASTFAFKFLQINRYAK